MKKLFLLFSLCVIANCLYAQDVDPVQLKNEGSAALKAKDYATAFAKYSEYLKLTDNQDEVVAFNCGVCADNIKKYPEAVSYFDVAIQKGYNLANAYIGKASAYREWGKNNEYVATLEAGMKAVPGNATIEKLYAIYYLKAGQQFQKAGNIDKAEESYKHVTEVTNKKWKTDALYSLGVLFYNTGAQTLQKAAPLASSNKKEYDVEKAQADTYFKKAAEYLQQAKNLSPERTEIGKILTQVQNMIK